MFDGERKKDCPPHQRYDKQPSKSVVIEYTEKHSALLCDWHSCRFLFNGEALPPTGRPLHFYVTPVRVSDCSSAQAQYHRLCSALRYFCSETWKEYASFPHI